MPLFSLTHIADSYRDKTNRSKNGGLNARASAESEGSPDETFPAGNRKKPGQLRDTLAAKKNNAADAKNGDLKSKG